MAIVTSTHHSLGTVGIDPRSAELGAAVLRIALGVMWIAHALLKLFVFTLPGTAQFFVSVGLPGPLAYIVFTAEFVGGTLILLGWHGRWVSLAMIPILLGAAAVHLPNGWVFSAAGGGWEYPVFLMVASAAHALIGDGRYALAGARTPRFALDAA